MTGEEQQKIQQALANMTPEEQQKFQTAAATMAKLLYEHTPDEGLQDLEGIELALREHWLNTVGPELALFFSLKVVAPQLENRAKSRVVSAPSR